MGQESTEKGGKSHVVLARGAKEQELNGWGEFKVRKPVRKSKAVVDSRWALARKMMGGGQNAKARLLAEDFVPRVAKCEGSLAGKMRRLVCWPMVTRIRISGRALRMPPDAGFFVPRISRSFL